MASSPQMIPARIELPISSGDVGKFIGAKAVALRKFVINKSKNSFSDDHDGEEFTLRDFEVHIDEGGRLDLVRCVAAFDILELDHGRMSSA